MDGEKSNKTNVIGYIYSEKFSARVAAQRRFSLAFFTPGATSHHTDTGTSGNIQIWGCCHGANEIIVEQLTDLFSARTGEYTARRE